jgi:hypothetical protein
MKQCEEMSCITIHKGWACVPVPDRGLQYGIDPDATQHFDQRLQVTEKALMGGYADLQHKHQNWEYNIPVARAYAHHVYCMASKHIVTGRAGLSVLNVSFSLRSHADSP